MASFGIESEIQAEDIRVRQQLIKRDILRISLKLWRESRSVVVLYLHAESSCTIGHFLLQRNQLPDPVT